ncbi:hypothetical protein J6590_072191 [Homalodisca vitripennis]|nr:hypothetical protein J6590_072191 [Homalodisca vitripennis]
MKLSDFRMELSVSLCKQGKPVTPGRDRPRNEVGELIQEKKKKGPEAPAPPKDIRFDQIAHWPQFTESRQRCKLVVWGQISKDQIIWRWCTLVDDAYLNAFSTAYNKAMTCVCALITVNCNPRSLEDYTQFNNYRNIISAVVTDAKIISREILGADMGGHYFGAAAERVMTRKRLIEASRKEGGGRRR